MSHRLFVRHSVLRVLRQHRRARLARRHGLLVPITVAVALAAAGHLAASAVATSAAADAPRAQAVGGPRFLVREPDLTYPGPAATGLAVTAPRRAVRAERSAVRVAAAPQWVRPASGPFTSPFGQRWGRLHKGIDIGAAYGSPVYAVGAGVIGFARTHGGYGRRIEVRHGGTVTSYSHLSRILVSGGPVRAGQVIGYVGSSGQSTGPHLHFEVTVRGRLVNPRTWLRAHGVRI